METIYDWSQAPGWAKEAATDKNGIAYYYDCKACLNKGRDEWQPLYTDYKSKKILNNPYTGDWEQSREVRPDKREQPTINDCLIDQNKLDFAGLVKVLEQAQKDLFEGKAGKIGKTYDKMRAFADLANICVDKVRNCYAELKQSGISIDTPLESFDKAAEYHPGCKFNTEKFKIYNIS